MAEPTDIPDLCKQAGWSRVRLISALRKAAAARGRELPGEESMLKMVREWAHGRRQLSQDSAELFTAVFSLPFRYLGRDGDLHSTGTAGSEAEPPVEILLDHPAVDHEIVEVLEAHTESLRTLDRRLGAKLVLTQTEAHLGQVTEILSFCLDGNLRERLAGLAAETAALAGWQALDLADTTAAWRHHETAKSLSREAGDRAVHAHVTAQQAYVLVDLGRGADAVNLVRFARDSAGGKVPSLLRSWLAAAEAEAHAVAGEKVAAHRALETAHSLYPDESEDPALPYIFLAEQHLRRWRGAILARIGEQEAVDELAAALDGLEPSWTRAAAGLRTDLAIAHSVRGEHRDASMHAEAAEKLAVTVASKRQRKRISELLQNSRR